MPTEASAGTDVMGALDHRKFYVATSYRAAHRAGAVGLAVGYTAMVYLVARDHVAADWRPSGRPAWSLSLLLAGLLLARGVYLGRPVTGRHSGAALTMVLAGVGAHVLGIGLVGDLLVAASGLVLMWSLSPKPAAGPHSVWPLIRSTHGDALAPFAMGASKALFFNEERTAALTYRVRLGLAVVSADPVGDPSQYRALVRDFVDVCASLGWRIVVLNCAERNLCLWRDNAAGPAFTAVPVGRDVVVDVPSFALSGRNFRNLRQAVGRTRRRGITTEVVPEQCLSAELHAELADVIEMSRGGGRYQRGFSMMLDGVLSGRCPGVLLIIARDPTGTVQAFHRYAVAGDGSDVSLDLPWRRPGAPNGIDEGLTVDMIAWCRDRGASRLSVAFAAFPELFDEQNRSGVQRLYYALIRLGDPLIKLESLYRYLRKFHALGPRRYVLFPPVRVVSSLVVLLYFEFWPHRARRDRWHQRR